MARCLRVPNGTSHKGCRPYVTSSDILSQDIVKLPICFVTFCDIPHTSGHFPMPYAKNRAIRKPGEIGSGFARPPCLGHKVSIWPIPDVEPAGVRFIRIASTALQSLARNGCSMNGRAPLARLFPFPRFDRGRTEMLLGVISLEVAELRSFISSMCSRRSAKSMFTRISLHNQCLEAGFVIRLRRRKPNGETLHPAQTSTENISPPA